MKLLVEHLLEHAKSTQRIVVAPNIEIITIDDPVDSETGTHSELERSRFSGQNVHIIAQILQTAYAGDCLFIVQTPRLSAVIRPPFSELPVFYVVTGDTVTVWSDVVIPPFVRRTRPGFNISYLGPAMLNPSWLTPMTGLVGVYELLSGGTLYATMLDTRRSTAWPTPLPTCSPR